MKREDQPDEVCFRKNQPVDWTVELLGDNIIFNGQFDTEFPVSQVNWLITCLKHFQNMRLPEGVEEPEVVLPVPAGGWTTDKIVACSFGETRYIPSEDMTTDVSEKPSPKISESEIEEKVLAEIIRSKLNPPIGNDRSQIGNCLGGELPHSSIPHSSVSGKTSNWYYKPQTKQWVWE